jgi:hypothetical protein
MWLSTNKVLACSLGLLALLASQPASAQLPMNFVSENVVTTGLEDRRTPPSRPTGACW